jgi:hypothetical protein
MSDVHFGLFISITLLASVSSWADEQNEATTITDPNKCSIRIIQDSKEVLPVITDNIPSYKLLAKDFKVEIAPIACSPSITLSDRQQIDYLTKTPLVFSTGGYWILFAEL